MWKCGTTDKILTNMSGYIINMQLIHVGKHQMAQCEVGGPEVTVHQLDTICLAYMFIIISF